MSDNQDRRDFIRKAGMLGMLPAFAFSLKNEKIPELVLPPAIKKGDAIGLVSPAGAVFERKSIDEFIRVLEEYGFSVLQGKTLSLKTGYFAGDDKARAVDVMDMFRNKSVKGIFCAKGGWGSARILPLLDYAAIRENAKMIVGFSDITALLTGITMNSGLVTFHGPVGNSSWNEFSWASCEKCVVQKEEQMVKFPSDITIWSQGTGSGPLWGGNLSVLCSLAGTPYMPELSGGILFLEETTEEPYRIDRMLTQLKQIGVFEKISGLAFGKCTRCVAEEPEKAFTVEEVFSHHFSGLKIPVVSGLPFGHTGDKLTIPIGLKSTLDTIAQTWTLPVAVK